MQGLIGKKIGMTRVFDEAGKSIAVTVILTGKNIVHQIKTQEKDGYSAVQLGFQEVAEKKLSKPLIGHFKKLSSTPTKVIKEFALDEGEQLTPGQQVGVEILENTKLVDVVGISKGRGFAGTIKRHKFHRGRKTHGSGNVREHGSVGANSYPARVMPGMKMAGHMGAIQMTAKRLELVSVDKEAGLVFVRGSVPGHNEAVVYIRKFLNK